jgi:hypothetical protein
MKHRHACANVFAAVNIVRKGFGNTRPSVGNETLV